MSTMSPDDIHIVPVWSVRIADDSLFPAIVDLHEQVWADVGLWKSQLWPEVSWGRRVSAVHQEESAALCMRSGSGGEELRVQGVAVR